MSVWAELLSRPASLLTTNCALLETATLTQQRLGMAALRTFEDDVVPVIEVEWVSGELHRSAMQAVLAAGRRKLSLVDCVSFQTMRRNGIHAAFCFDSHFREQGFALLS